MTEMTKQMNQVVSVTGQPAIDYKNAIEEGLNDVRTGHIKPFDEMQEMLRGKYGLYRHSSG